MGTDRIDLDFAAELARLKRRGSAVLVRGDGDDLALCTDLLGSDEERRYRVLVRSADAAVLPVPPDGAEIVDVTTSDARSSVEHEVAAFDPGAVASRVDVAEGLATVTSAVAQEVERIGGAGVEPGELRVCLGRLGPHLTRETRDSVVDAVGDLSDAVREYSGMCHAHLAAAEPEALAALELVFDVTVESRTTPTCDHQRRWHLHAAGIDTGWLQPRSR